MGIIKKYQNGNKISTDYDVMMDTVIKLKGGTKSDYENIMNSIAYHESAGTFDIRKKQIGGGPGRGLFQFEIGDDKGGKTAVNRTINHLKKYNKEIPKWLINESKKVSVDVSTLDDKKQKILFLGYHLEHPEADLGKVVHGKESIVDFWGKYHQTQNDPEKKKKFLEDQIRYEKSLNKKTIIKNEKSLLKKDVDDFYDPLNDPLF